MRAVLLFPLFASTVLWVGLWCCLRHWDLDGYAVGPRPAYGLFLRNCEGVAVDGLELRWESTKRTERRPAFVIENASEISLLQVSFPVNLSRYLVVLSFDKGTCCALGDIDQNFSQIMGNFVQTHVYACV